MKNEIIQLKDDLRYYKTKSSQLESQLIKMQHKQTDLREDIDEISMNNFINYSIFELRDHLNWLKRVI